RRMRRIPGVSTAKVTIAYRGIPLEHYRTPAPARHRHRLVYTSNSRYGLALLLRLFPRVQAVVPEAELYIFGSEYDRTDAIRDLQTTLQGATQPGVYWRGSLSKSALAYELRSACIMAYPNQVKETFSQAVAEAQAA